MNDELRRVLANNVEVLEAGRLPILELQKVDSTPTAGVLLEVYDRAIEACRAALSDDSLGADAVKACERLREIVKAWVAFRGDPESEAAQPFLDASLAYLMDHHAPTAEKIKSGYNRMVAEPLGFPKAPLRD